MLRLSRRCLIPVFVLLTTAGLMGCVQPSVDRADSIKLAFERRQSDVAVEDEGKVIRVLADDASGARHQRFVVQLASGQTVLIQHNIDIAPRLADLTVGDTVRFAGEYVWNEQGGLVHWTHHDPGGRHPGGWLKHNGRLYQ